MFIKSLEQDLKKDENFLDSKRKFKKEIEELSAKKMGKKKLVMEYLKSSDDFMISSILYLLSQKLAVPEYEEILLYLLKSKDEYLKYKSCQILTFYYSNSIPHNDYFVFIKKHLRGNSYDSIDQILYLLTELLYSKKESLRVVDKKIFDRSILKIKFCENDTFISILKSLIKVPELQYNILMIIFILSYNTKCLTILIQNKLIEEVVKILTNKSREKLMRVCTSIIKNYLEKGFHFTICISNEVVAVCSDSYNDTEMGKDMQYIKEKCTAKLKEGSNIDSYFDELFSGQLEESPYHYSDSFWETNINTMLENKAEIIKAYKKHLKSTEITLVCVSANDIYRFVKAAPEIKSHIIKYGIQDDLFHLANSSDPDVRYHAIQALSGCIFCDWSSK